MATIQGNIQIQVMSSYIILALFTKNQSNDSQSEISDWKTKAKAGIININGYFQSK